MMAYWGGYEITLKRRLALLKAVNTLANPRFGVDRTTGWLMERLRSFYAADACMLVMADPATGEYHMRRADCHDPERAMHIEPLPEQLAQRLLALPAGYAVVYSRKRRVGWNPSTRYRAYDVVTRAHTTEGREMSEAFAASFDSRCSLGWLVHPSISGGEPEPRTRFQTWAAIRRARSSAAIGEPARGRRGVLPPWR